MFFNGQFFWFLMGIIAVLVMAGLNAFAKDQGWKMNWWKWLLTAIWYGLFIVTFYALGTLLGENEVQAAWGIFATGIVVTLILGVGLWRLLARDQSTATA
ncbi:MAG: hypothetical protein ACLFWD_02365 [Anaerolineales bacterium]